MNFSSESPGGVEDGQNLAKSLDYTNFMERKKTYRVKKKTSQKQVCRNDHRNSLQTPRRSQGD